MVPRIQGGVLHSAPGYIRARNGPEWSLDME